MAARSTGGPHRWLAWLAVAAIGVTLWLVGDFGLGSAPPRDPWSSAPPPDPWPAPATSCEHAPGVSPLDAASRRLATADARAGRRAFDAAAAMPAVELYAQAAACFRQAGVLDAARAAATRGERLQRELGLELRRRQLLLERAIQDADWRRARHELSHLTRLVRHRPGEYGAWLRRLERQLPVAEGAGP